MPARGNVDRVQSLDSRRGPRHSQFFRRNMNKTQKLLTALGLVSGVAFTAALAAVPNNTLLSMQIGDPSTYDPVPLRRHR